MKNCTVVCLCAGLILFFLLGSCFAEGSSGYQQAYIAMLEEFDRGNYVDAYTVACMVYKANPEYQEIVNYYNYLTALQVYLSKGQYKDAYDIFSALALRQFQKSEGYAAYALGCKYEMDNDYDAALNQYIVAFTNSIDEAYQKIQDCKKKSNEEKYNQAIFQQQQKNYLVAAEYYELLINEYPDAREKAKECYYYAAEEYSREGKYDDAANYFTKIADYKDSKQKAIQNRAWASGDNGIKRLGLRMEDSTSTSLTLTWDDETALGSFTVTYMPAGIKTQMNTIKQSNTSITLENLLPNTQYTVSVSSPINDLFSETNNYWTNQAPPVTDYNARGLDVYIWQLDRAAVNRLGPAKVINTESKTDKCINIAEYGYHAPDRKPSETNYDIYVNYNFFADKFITPESAEITLILRLDGKTSVGKTETVQLMNEGYEMLSANITDLMDELFDNVGITGSELSLDVYLNGQHMGTKVISIDV